jgi:hypothetical protein
MHLIPVSTDVIYTSIEYAKFPKCDLLVALLDKAMYYADEIEPLLERTDSSIEDWSVIGVGENSPGTYYVMDMRKFFIHNKNRKTVPFEDFNIFTNGPAFYPVHVQDCQHLLTFDGSESISCLHLIEG